MKSNVRNQGTSVFLVGIFKRSSIYTKKKPEPTNQNTTFEVKQSSQEIKLWEHFFLSLFFLSDAKSPAFIQSHPLAQDLPRTPGHVLAEEPPACGGGGRSGEQQGHHRPREVTLQKGSLSLGVQLAKAPEGTTLMGCIKKSKEWLKAPLPCETAQSLF